MLKVYSYQGCSTCKNATKWLRQHGIAFEESPIREQPPSLRELQSMLTAKGELRALFNVSGQDYRALNLKDKLPSMTSDDALKLLAGNGNLIKRPFVIDSENGTFLLGFKEPEWHEALR